MQKGDIHTCVAMLSINLTLIDSSAPTPAPLMSVWQSKLFQPILIFFVKNATWQRYCVYAATWATSSPSLKNKEKPTLNKFLIFSHKSFCISRKWGSYISENGTSKLELKKRIKICPPPKSFSGNGTC